MKIEYTLMPRRRWVYRFLFILYALGGLYGLYSLIFANDLTVLEKFILAPLLIIMGISSGSEFFYRGFFQRLVLLPDGIQHHTFGYMVSTEWSGIKRIGDYSKGLSTFNGIFVDYSAQNVKTWLPGIVSRKEIFIPLPEFAKNWRTSELGQQIKQHVPQLFSSVEN